MIKGSDGIKNFIHKCWYSDWSFAIRRVLSQWITGIVLTLIGIWTVQSLFSFSITRISDFLPEAVRFLINNNIHTIVRVFICFIVFVVVFQVIYRHKHYEEMSYITELQYSNSKSFRERLQRCELGTIYCEGRKETLLIEKDFIKSCSPIPIVTAILGYVIEKVGLANFNWRAFVIICICMILIYVFLCIRNIQKFKDNQWKINRWREAKINIEIKQEAFSECSTTAKP